jgi:hypothetical protein
MHDPMKGKFLAKLPKKNVDPGLKGREKRLAEAALAEQRKKELEAEYHLTVDEELNAEIKGLEDNDMIFLAQKQRSE